MLKKTLIALSAAVVMVIAVVAVGAQDAPDDTFGGRGGFRGGFIGDNTELVLEYTGLTQEELWAAMQDGATLTELIEANGLSVDDYIAAAVADAQAALDEAVADGRITQEQADEIAANLEENITARVSGEFEAGMPGGRGGLFMGMGDDADLLLEYTGLTQEELWAAMQDGATLTELIEANGLSVDDYIAAAVADAQAALDTAVAEGRITQEQADEIAANLEENVTARVSGELGAGMPGGPGGDGEPPAGGPGGDGEPPAGGPGGDGEPPAGGPGGDGEPPAGGPGGNGQPPAGGPGGGNGGPGGN